jgi:hypothetical protein
MNTLSVAASTIDPEIDLLFDFIKHPEHHIAHVHEQYKFEEWGIETTTKVRLNKETVGFPWELYLDVLHPNKGVCNLIEVLTPGVVLASHYEHTSIAKKCIHYRFGFLLKSIRFTGTATLEQIAQIYGRVFDVAAAMAKIPDLNSSQALNILYSNFEKDGQIKELPYQGSFEYDKSVLDGIFRLCKMLSRKYLSLLHLPSQRNRSDIVEFRTRKRYDDYGIENGVDKQKEPDLKHTLFAALPNTARIHLPWAKKTASYTLSIDAPEGSFFSANETHLLSRSDETKPLTELRPEQEDTCFGWSLSAQGMKGSHIDLFIGNARNSLQPLYLSTVHYEIPGRSTMRMAGLALLTSILILVMALSLTREEISNSASVVVAVFALCFAVSPAPKEEGFFSIPLFSRITPAIIIASLCLFIGWSYFGETIPYWNDCGWTVSLAISLALAVKLVMRCCGLMNRFRESSCNRSLRGGLFR